MAIVNKWVIFINEIIAINKSYGQMSKSDKEYILNVYYQFKDVPVAELRIKLGISQRAMLSVMKEYNIQSKRKNRYTVNEHFFDKIDNEKKAYILGYIYADGYVGDEKTNNIVISSKDLQILKNIAEAMEFTGEIRKARKGGYEGSTISYVINFSSMQIASRLRGLGLYPNKSLTIGTIPSIPDELKRHFLRGYFDGDGTITRNINNRKWKSKVYSYERFSMLLIATLPMIEDIIRTFNIKKYSIKKSKTKEMFYLRISAKSEMEYMYELMYKDATIYLERKYEIWLSFGAFILKDMSTTGENAGTTRTIR